MKLTPKNWHAFQHYKDRNPPWIKVHKSLLDDRGYQRLPLASRALAPMLWLLASEHEDGVFDASLDELTFRLRQSNEEIAQGLQPLVAAGFFEVVDGDAISVLADCQQLAVPEERREESETEGEAEAGLPCPQPSRQKPSIPDCPHDEIRRLWVEKLPGAIHPRSWTNQRAADLKRRWREDPKRQNLDWWAGLFDHIATSDFLMGRTSSPGRSPFALSLDWLCKAENFAKTLDGHYDSKPAGVPA